MTTLWIILGIAVFLALLLLLPVTLQIVYASSLTLRLKILFFSIQLVPKKQHPIRLHRFSKRGLTREKRRSEKKARLAAERARKKKVKKETARSEKKSTQKKEKRSFSDIMTLIGAILDLLKTVTSRFSRNLGLSIKQLDISIGSDDAATTALLCGTANSAALALVEFLRNNTRFDDKSIDHISIQPDFLSESCQAAVDIRFQLNLLAVFDMLTHTLIKFIKHKEHIFPSPKKDKELSSHD